jgi:orotidine-5'-phosphate decarboxylase
MTRDQLYNSIKDKESYLCVGLDTDIQKIPRHLRGTEDPVFEFNKQIIDATASYCVAYKPNIAFYESLGPAGWESLQKTIEYIPDDIFTIADAKRGDIGNTATMYARAFFETMDFDAITVAPYMGRDSVMPFLEFKDKWTILLALTSNPGSADFQQLNVLNKADFFDVVEHNLFEIVVRKSQEWASADQLMFVVGATQTKWMSHMRSIAPDNFFLVPGIGAQGGSLKDVSAAGLNIQCGLLVNSSRNIIYASDSLDFAQKAGEQAKNIKEEMQVYLNQYCS